MRRTGVRAAVLAASLAAACGLPGGPTVPGGPGGGPPEGPPTVVTATVSASCNGGPAGDLTFDVTVPTWVRAGRPFAVEVAATEFPTITAEQRVGILCLSYPGGRLSNVYTQDVSITVPNQVREGEPFPVTGPAVSVVGGVRSGDTITPTGAAGETVELLVRRQLHAGRAPALPAHPGHGVRADERGGAPGLRADPRALSGSCLDGRRRTWQDDDRPMAERAGYPAPPHAITHGGFGGRRCMVTARIREFVVDTFLLGDDDGFDDDDSLIEGGIVDSTGVMELVSFLEETYGIAIEDRELVAANLDSITRLRAFVDGKVALAAAPVGAVPAPGTAV